jgi:hypothetical protein
VKNAKDASCAASPARKIYKERQRQVGRRERHTHVIASVDGLFVVRRDEDGAAASLERNIRTPLG